MFYKSVLLLIGFCVLSRMVSCNPISQNTDLKKVIEALNTEDRSDFIAMHLAFGLLKLRIAPFGHRLTLKLPEDIHVPIDTYNKLLEIEVPEDFSTDLYVWTKIIYELNDYNTYELITLREVCFPYGCFDLGDIGSLCCPF